MIRNNLVQIVLIILVSVLAISCGKKRDRETSLGAYGLYPETTAYNIQCVTEPWPAAPSGGSAIDPMSIPLPENLPGKEVPIDVQSCDALGCRPPNFYYRTMPGFTAVVDCNTRIVRFKTRDWQITEGARISPNGRVDANVMLITRLVQDADGDSNCWMRFLGHISGQVDCNHDPRASHVNLRVDWRFDETPPEVMEPASPGMADLRNGKHCSIRPGNCFFSNNVSMGCGG